MLTFAIPTWNRANYLSNCLQAIIDQAVMVADPIRIVVFDNCSDDETPEVLREFKERYPDILEYTRNDVHCDAQVNFMRCFTATSTIWTWTMGDDDLLTEGALRMVLRIIKANNYLFLHVAETTRCAGEKAIYPGTLQYLVERIGLIEMTGFISGNICRTDKLKQAFTSRHMMTYNQSCFSQSLALLEALAQEPCAFVNMALVDLQEKEQTSDTLARWTAANNMMRYNLLASGLQLLVDDGIIPAQLPDEFFRYLGGNLFGKILFTFWQQVNETDQQVADVEWQQLLHLTRFLSAESREAKTAVILNYRQKLDTYVEMINTNIHLLEEIDATFQEVTPVRYPETYM